LHRRRFRQLRHRPVIAICIGNQCNGLGNTLQSGLCWCRKYADMDGQRGLDNQHQRFCKYLLPTHCHSRKFSFHKPSIACL